MHRLLLTGGLCLALGACATAAPQTHPTCNGQHRRPANPNGSALVTPTVAARAVPARPAAPATESFLPCGDRP